MIQMDTKAWGVLIADVIGSSSTPNLRSLLSAKLRIASLAHQELLRLPYAITAGDEFQTLTAQLNGLPWLGVRSAEKIEAARSADWHRHRPSSEPRAPPGQ